MSVSESHAGSPAQPPAKSDRKRKIVFWLVAYSLIVGPPLVFVPDGSNVLSTLLTLPLLVLGVSWCHTDARQRGFRLGRAWTLFLVFLSIIAFPIYFFRTRGIRGIKTLFLAVALCIVMMICMAATGLVTLLIVDAIWPGYARELLGISG